MNKLIFVLLAICLVSVHAYVKRDAPAPSTDKPEILQTIQNELTKFQGQIAKAVDPEAIKTNFNTLIEQLSEAVNKLKEVAQPATPTPKPQ